MATPRIELWTMTSRAYIERAFNEVDVSSTDTRAVEHVAQASSGPHPTVPPCVEGPLTTTARPALSGRPAVGRPAPVPWSVRRAARAGMTLMEVMIVVALIAALTAVTAYGLGFIGRADVQGEALRLSGIIRYIYNQAATQNRTLQLVIDLDEGTLTVDELDVLGGMTREELAGESLALQRDEDDDESLFDPNEVRATRIDEEDEQFARIQRSPISGPLLDEEDRGLAEGVYIVGVMTSHHEQLQTEGMATINFFPSGFVERSVIYVGNEDARNSEDQGIVFTLMINSLTGQTTIRPGRVEVETTFFDAEEDS